LPRCWRRVHTKDAWRRASAKFIAIRDGKARTTAGEKLYGDAIDKMHSRRARRQEQDRRDRRYTTHGMSHELAICARFTKQAARCWKWDAARWRDGQWLFANSPFLGLQSDARRLAGAPRSSDMTDDPADDQLTGARTAIAIRDGGVQRAQSLLESANRVHDPVHHTFARDAGQGRRQPGKAPPRSG